MPVPVPYIEASNDFRRFLVELRDLALLTTTNQAFTVTEGVLLAFRRRLDPVGVARFCHLLPPVLRALFVEDWDPSEPLRSFDDDDAVITAEVQGLRAGHNFATAASVREVARALRKNVDEASLDQALVAIGPGAVRFWRK